MKRLLLISVLILAGCSPPPPTAVGTDHPANPNAATGAASSHTTIPVTAVPDEHAAHQHDHGAHQHQPADSGEPAKALYMCPMHPEVTSANPEDRCPKCGMKIDKPVPAEPHP